MRDKPPASAPSVPPAPAGDPALFDRLLAVSGRDSAVVAALLAFDGDIFQWRRAMLRGDGLASMLKRAGLSLELVEFQALITVDRLAADGDAVITVGALAQEMGLDPSRASRLATRLIGLGHLRRGVAQDDARKVVLELTPSGRETLEIGRSHKWARYVEIFADWQDEEITAFAALLHRYVDAMRQFDSTALKP